MSEQTRYQVLDRAPWRLTDWLLRWETILCILLVLVIVVNAVGSPYFLDVYNLSDMTQNFSEKAIIALGMALLILTREIDLSVAATVALCSLAIGYAAQAGYGPAPLIGVGILVGIVCGAFNGWLVTGFGLPSIVVTIGTMSLYRGIAQVVLGDQAITTYPDEYTSLAQGYIIQTPPLYLAFILFLVLALIFAIVVHFTPWGRMLYAIGNNPVAARFSGIPVNRIRFLLFVLTGLLSGLASALLTARIGSTRPNIALGWELEVVTVAVLGGMSIAGGSGTIPGVVIAVFVLGLTTFGLTLINVPGIVINVILGVLLVAAIALPIIVRRVLGMRAQ
ncbi:ABC transporter permease [Labrys miyagiensis]|uniref:Autoinducer 2 import system permease protein LsrD n=1 Tax=Labrys miyagiensis TaxID=346912 RepID=A0ABQ6CBA0_9HYPH|nr:ABC transporter permease [Labrys miyagiensis]GLS17551.1 ABC transporter permease [Labrys miyagiensis]